MRDDEERTGSDDYLKDANVSAGGTGPSALQVDEIEDLKISGLMDAEGNWVPRGTKLPPYERKHSAPQNAPVYRMRFRNEQEATERAKLIEGMVDVKHRVVDNADGTYSIVQLETS